MIHFFGWLRPLAFACCIASVIACSPKVVVSTSSIDEAYTAESDTVSFVAKALQDSIPEYMAMRSSWEQYQYALQAIDDEEWLLAGHYLDVSLKQLVLEKYDTNCNIEKDRFINPLFVKFAKSIGKSNMVVKSNKKN